MLGFSVYLDHQLTADDYNYLIAMRNAGFKQIYTSLLVKEEAADVLSHLQELVKWGQNLDLKIVAAVSQASLARLGFDIADVGQMQGLGLSSVKVSDETSNQVIAKLSKSMPVSINAGLITIDKLADLKEYNANLDNVIAGYNYYPQAFSGIDDKWFKSKNKWLHAQKLQVSAFVSGDVLPQNEAGRSTLESERGCESLAGMLDLKKMNCDNVFVGDVIKAETIESFSNYLKEKAITLHLDQNVPPLVDNSWHNQLYVGQDVISLKETQELTGQADSQLSRGTVVIANEKYGDFAGHLAIAKKDLPADERINTVAHIANSDLPLLSFIAPGQQIIFAQTK